MSLEMKGLVLGILEEAGSLGFTRERLASMEMEIEEKIFGLEKRTGEKNYVLRLLFERLKVK